MGQPAKLLRCLTGLAFLTLLTTLSGQSCPPANGSALDAPSPSVLHGTIRRHDGTRPWLGLILEQPACGATEIELAFSEDGWQSAKRMRNCAVTVQGKISDSPTVYYSTDLNLFDPKITPDTTCHLLSTERDYSRFRIPGDVRSYKLTVFIDVKDDKPLRGEVLSPDSSSRSLTPWQAYADLMLNGEKDLNLGCRDSFNLISWGSSNPKEAQELDNAVLLSSSDLGPAWLTIECRRK